MRRWRKRALALAAVVGIVGILLGAAQGTQTDPLVTISYLDSVATPKAMKEVEAKLDQREQALVDKLNAVADQMVRDIEAKVGNGSGSGGSYTSSAYTVVTVEAGKSLLGNTGCEFLVRSGTAKAVAASAPGLIDATSGGTLSDGGAVEPNHLYMTTADGRGFQATAAVTALVRGTYTIA